MTAACLCFIKYSYLAPHRAWRLWKSCIPYQLMPVASLGTHGINLQQQSHQTSSREVDKL